MSVHDPVADLALADAASRRLAGRTRWMRPFYLVLGTGFAAVVLACGFASLTTIFVMTGIFLAIVAVMIVWVARQGVVRRGISHLHITTMVVGSALYVAALQVGQNVFPGVPAFWIPAAAVVAIPFVVAAVVAGRAAGPR